MRHAYMEALSHITGDVVLTFSPDGNSIPELIPECIKKMKEGFDMVIVSRYAQQTVANTIASLINLSMEIIKIVVDV